MSFDRLHRSFLVALLAVSGAAIAQDPPQPASGQPAATEPALVAPAPAPAPTSAPTAATSAGGTIVAPAEGKGQVVFFRPSKFAGAAIGFQVREGETSLGKLRSGNYFVASVEPGTHVYTVHSEAKDVLTLEVEAGETYYVEGTISMGFMVGHPNLSPSDQATFDGMSAKLKRVD